MQKPKPSNPAILSLDPSTTRTGYAITTPTGRTAASGAIRPPRSRLPYDRATYTVDRLVATLPGVAAPFDLVEIVAEAPGKLTAANRRGSPGANEKLATYAFGAGVIVGVLADRLGLRVRLMSADKWRGASKRRRMQFAAAVVPDYRPEDDPGGDVADAVCIGQWAAQTYAEPGQ